MRVAVVDLGTNSTRLLVADVDDGRTEEVARRTAITRLGEGVDERRKLLPLPIARVRNVLADYRREVEELGAERTLAIGTSAIRDAEKGPAFLGEIEWSYGFTTRLLSGEDEGELTRRGVAGGRELEPGTLVLDVGGGSTELTIDRSRVSLDLGCVRVTERFLHSDPPTREEVEAASSAVRDALPDFEPTQVVGVAGTVTTLASLARAQRQELPGLEPERAPVIVAGAIIVREVLDRYGLGTLEASERDILHGAALEAAALPPAEEGDAPPGAYTCC